MSQYLAEYDWVHPNFLIGFVKLETNFLVYVVGATLSYTNYMKILSASSSSVTLKQNSINLFTFLVSIFFFWYIPCSIINKDL